MPYEQDNSKVALIVYEALARRTQIVSLLTCSCHQADVTPGRNPSVLQHMI